jgi:hypothetical protein
LISTIPIIGTPPDFALFQFVYDAFQRSQFGDGTNALPLGGCGFIVFGVIVFQKFPILAPTIHARMKLKVSLNQQFLHSVDAQLIVRGTFFANAVLAGFLMFFVTKVVDGFYIVALQTFLFFQFRLLCFVNLGILFGLFQSISGPAFIAVSPISICQTAIFGEVVDCFGFATVVARFFCNLGPRCCMTQFHFLAFGHSTLFAKWFQPIFHAFVFVKRSDRLGLATTAVTLF